MNYIIAGLVIALLALLSWHLWDVNHLKAKQVQAIEDQKKADIQQCDKTTKPAIESDANEIKKLNDNLNACLDELHKNAICVPVSDPASKPKTTKKPIQGLTYYSIIAHNLYCKQQVDTNNNNIDWATSCIKQGLCQ